MLKLDSDFEIKKIFRDTVKILIYRKEKDKTTENLKVFFEDFYQVIFITQLSEWDSSADLANILEEDLTEVKKIACNAIWVETEAPKKEKGVFFGKMKEVYRKLFMDQCSA